MVVATTDIDIKKIVSLESDYGGLCQYIKSLVPDHYAHIDAIYHNTRYYINLQVLKDNNIPMDKKTELSKYLTKNIRVVGFMGKYISCEDLEMHIDMQKVKKYREGDKHEEVRFSKANN